MEVVCKVVTVIINCFFAAYISFHGVHHFFGAGCGTGTASLEAKMIQQLTAMRWDILCVIFLGLNK